MILVTGATGNVGSEVVGALLRAGADVRALVRNENVVLPEGAERAIGDLNDPDSLTPALRDVRGVFLLPGYRDVDGLLDRMSRAGVEWGDVPVASIDPLDIGEVAARAFLDGKGGQALQLCGPEALLPAQRLEVLGDVLGRDLGFEALPDDVARAEMEAAMPVEYVDAFFSFYSDGTLDEASVHPTVEEVTGRPARNFRQWAEAHADAFRA
ncbi:NmrA family NAD(P)-binding protein [Saccharothrix deserti]|uniref:NmrA family NAD(P)-binding protein n=1 Tax=Saccharothrix deserti TaxID=2593674 RepID=UPI00131E526E|nr:NmrA family NAD(P)-binding protein [Saccharothrix deserti]